ncbi:(deoxy)nucleoside triphosphate pyrophosphohydrolase [Faecalicatena contorta]|uniref:8-oxo-dGTP diphosphatase n=1 Tax=Faecalicatena contorta TaxID=39482 RepID=A0A315ZYH1_9FIRM|nr:(deoxy)nucleoside triphosphate pyrophosphohydrolase [Faecalicatena contorta]PWJ50289.1 8-oxo-dGTP diphosphatase [Faecalicatena contorta]SUQ13697.1 8-oxo-dGTP diphosphatase [Faecalicatena contorta]
MRKINVVAAILQKDGQVLSAQRGYGEFEGNWEFPGGKIEIGETPQEALHREIKEELGIEIQVNDLFDTVEYDYLEFHLIMQCYLCKITEGNIMLNEHKVIKWLGRENIDSVEWLPADIKLVERLKNSLL